MLLLNFVGTSSNDNQGKTPSSMWSGSPWLSDLDPNISNGKTNSLNDTIQKSASYSKDIQNDITNRTHLIPNYDQEAISFNNSEHSQYTKTVDYQNQSIQYNDQKNISRATEDVQNKYPNLETESNIHHREYKIDQGPWSAKPDQHCNPNASNSIGNDSNLQAPTMEHKPQKFVGRDSINPNPTNDREIDIDNYNIRDLDPEWRDDDSDHRSTFDIAFDKRNSDQTHPFQEEVAGFGDSQSGFGEYYDLSRQATAEQRSVGLAPSLLRCSSRDSFSYSPSTASNLDAQKITNQNHRPTNIGANQSFSRNDGNDTLSERWTPAHMRNNDVSPSRLPNNWTSLPQTITSDTQQVGPTVNQRQLNQPSIGGTYTTDSSKIKKDLSSISSSIEMTCKSNTGSSKIDTRMNDYTKQPGISKFENYPNLNIPPPPIPPPQNVTNVPNSDNAKQPLHRPPQVENFNGRAEDHAFQTNLFGTPPPPPHSHQYCSTNDKFQRNQQLSSYPQRVGGLTSNANSSPKKAIISPSSSAPDYSALLQYIQHYQEQMSGSEEDNQPKS